MLICFLHSIYLEFHKFDSHLLFHCKAYISIDSNNNTRIFAFYHSHIQAANKLKIGTFGAFVSIDYKEFIIVLINIYLPLTAMEAEEKIEEQEPI